MKSAMQPDVEFVYFDLDDTLIDHKRSEQRALANVYRHFFTHFRDYPLSTVQETYSTYNDALWKKYAQGKISREEVQNERFTGLIDALNLTDVSSDALSNTYLWYYARHWQFVDGARRAFDQIKNKFPVGVLTNGFADVQYAKLDRFALRNDLESLVISEEHGTMKPDPDIFAHATRQAGVRAENIFYVGNSFLSDVQGGYNAGWNVGWFTETGVPEDRVEGIEPKNIFTFENWQQLLHHLNGNGAVNGTADAAVADQVVAEGTLTS